MSSPDVQIFPHATGEAAKTVEKHQEPQDLIFYSGWFCPYVQRTWIALEERGIPYQYVEVNPYKKEKHFLEINPKGLVPAVEYKGRALYESLILCEFLEDTYPAATPRLLPADTAERAYARIWVDFVTKNVVPNFMRLIQAQSPEKQDAARADLYKGLRTFADQARGPYFLGDEFSLVDVALAPWIVREWVVVENRGYDRAAVSDPWKKYADLVEQRDSIRRTSSERQHFIDIYGRYLRDEAQSEAAKAIREGRAIP
ncbi:glutathione S-transferase family protein [Phanerochaete sordida]|uniref:Glutathione S-transferase family protein n=1 Tax=Phanerochaete sordida TaxID=48140 RepID=A0A9P3GAK9_9APHY|nr:glutathione S-transferase family protein [Phanerochaete sordida]